MLVCAVACGLGEDAWGWPGAQGVGLDEMSMGKCCELRGSVAWAEKQCKFPQLQSPVDGGVWKFTQDDMSSNGMRPRRRPVRVPDGAVTATLEVP